MEDHRGQDVVFLELGVGYNTPGIIKYNFWQYAHNWRNAFYVCINKGDAYVPKEIKIRRWESMRILRKCFIYAIPEIKRLLMIFQTSKIISKIINRWSDINGKK